MLQQLLPPALRRSLKQTYQSVIDAGEGILTRRSPLVPPRSKVFVGAGEFVAVGQGFRQHFIEQGKLLPHEAVLDVGCGIGRMAVPLTDYLTPPRFI
jgi:2-polyprenyl-3-methyl-5-hydroxy-6-metoxy-1,4-benzoquinol methylase